MSKAIVTLNNTHIVRYRLKDMINERNISILESVTYCIEDVIKTTKNNEIIVKIKCDTDTGFFDVYKGEIL